RNDFQIIRSHLLNVFEQYRIHVFLLSPAIWEGSPPLMVQDFEGSETLEKIQSSCPSSHEALSPALTRYEIIETLSPYLINKAVICNLGFPSKELYNIRDQVSNFYMLGSMGMATPIGIGVAISTKKDVIVIDGDGSILMNPNSLAMAALLNPENLTIIVIDNGAYGSTGNQPTLTSTGLDLEHIARAFGIRNTIKASDREGIKRAMEAVGGLRFIHILALPGNRDVPNIPVHHLEIKRRFQEFLKG
ncbi:MAG: sulfopyruvate decarboxylase subunit beta, partial [Thermodesulfovibrionales bacterium]